MEINNTKLAEKYDKEPFIRLNLELLQKLTSMLDITLTQKKRVEILSGGRYSIQQK